MIGLSPKGVLEAVTIFPVMFLISVVLDILAILFAPFWIIINIIGCLTIGLWVIIRSGGKRSAQSERGKQKGSQIAPIEGGETAAKEGAEVTAREGAEVAAREGTEVAAREGAQVAAKEGASLLGRAVLRVGIAGALGFVAPVIGVILGWTSMVIWEFVSDLRSFDLEEGQ